MSEREKNLNYLEVYYLLVSKKPRYSIIERKQLVDSYIDYTHACSGCLGHSQELHCTPFIFFEQLIFYEQWQE
jgi:hypothetical protein